MPWSDEATELLALLHRVGNARHHHVADNDLDLATCKLIAKRQDACGIAPSQLFMLDRVGMLNIEQYHVGLVEHGIELLGMRGIERIAAAIQAGVHTTIGVIVHGVEQVGQKLRLQERLAAGHRNATAAIELVVTLELIHQVFDGHHGAAVDRPGIGIVAIRAAHGTALNKHHKADAGSVDRSHRLDRMHAAKGKRRVLGTSVHTLKRHFCHSRYLASPWMQPIKMPEPF